jgi:hypothetical protein
MQITKQVLDILETMRKVDTIHVGHIYRNTLSVRNEDTVRFNFKRMLDAGWLTREKKYIKNGAYDTWAYVYTMTKAGAWKIDAILDDQNYGLLSEL